VYKRVSSNAITYSLLIVVPFVHRHYKVCYSSRGRERFPELVVGFACARNARYREQISLSS